MGSAAEVVGNASTLVYSADNWKIFKSKGLFAVKLVNFTSVFRAQEFR